jgi:putative ABC transport system permease protein
LSDSDRADSPQVVVVSDSFVQRYLPGMNPLEHLLMLETRNVNGVAKPASAWRIVGVFHTVRNGEHLNDQSTPEIFVPFAQLPLQWMGLAVRTVFDPALISRDLRVTVAQSLPGYSLTGLQTMQETIDSQLTSDRFGMVLFGLFALLALLLAALGIYGVMAFAVAQRRHEIGLRMALGAQRSDVMRLILWDGLRLALTGTGIGMAGVYLLGRLLHSTLYEVNSVDAGSFGVVVLALLGVAVLASYLPARRSAKIDPMIALRQS